MTYNDPNLNPNDPVNRRADDPVNRRVDMVETRSDSGVTWFIVGALVIAAGVLAYLYFGDTTNTTADTGATITAPADTGRASTPAPAPAEPAAPAPAAPAAPSTPAPAPSNP